MVETPESLEPQSTPLPLANSVGGRVSSERNSRSRNHIISWDKIDSAAMEPGIPLSETKRTSAQGNQVKGSSRLRFASSLVTRMFYIIFRLLYGGAKFLIRGISEIRERLRS
jgi:hypothetical protein